jgi:glycosyltransferase involved in cell wall biosynthesis
VEHIVVDGGSTDGTKDLLREYETTYPMQWISEPDGGMYEAVNTGLKMARGDILAYLNSDDLYLPWAISEVVRCFEEHPKADAVFGDAINIDDSTGRQYLLFQPPFDLKYIRETGFLCQPSVFWRRRVLEMEGPFDESLRYVADCDYWMRAGARQRFVKLNEFVAIERDHHSTLRELDAHALQAELETVRSRYAPAGRVPRLLAALRHLILSVWWYRLQWLAFAAQALLPRSVRRRPWSRLLSSGHIRVRLRLVPLLLVQPHGRRFSHRIAHPSRYWLEPPR